MKRLQKISVLGMLLFLVFGNLSAQRLLLGQKGLWLSVGMPISETMPINRENCSVSVGFTTTTKHRNYWLYELSYHRKGYNYRKQTVPVEDVLFEGGYMLNILADSGKNILVNVGLSGLVGYERINDGKTHLLDGATLLNKDNFVYGASVGLSIEGYLCDNAVLFVKGKTVALWGTDLGQFRPQLSVGMRVLF